MDRWVLQGAIWPSQERIGSLASKALGFSADHSRGFLDGAPHPVDHDPFKKGIPPTHKRLPHSFCADFPFY